jgi:protein-arginine kinase activator protein McsA
MLEISFEDMAISVLAIAMLMVGFLLLGRRSTNKQRSRRAQREILQCDVCGHLYKDAGVERVIACPQCGRDNERGRDRSLG